MPRHVTKIPTLSVFMLLLLLLSPASPAGAYQATVTPSSSPVATPAPDSGPRFVIYPQGGGDGDYFTLEAEPGSTNELVVVLGNADDEPLKLETYASNVLPITNGGFAIGEAEDEPEGTTAWLQYPNETFEFEPGEGVERTFTVTVPDDAEPGQYITGIALATAEPLEVEGTTLFNQIIRKTIAVFIIVPGPEEPAFELGEAVVDSETPVDQIIIPVQNIGNVFLSPKGEVTVRDADGKVVVTAPVQMGSVYAGFTVPLSIALTTPLPEGNYTVSVNLKDETSGVSATISDAPIAIVPEEEVVPQVTVEGTVTLAPDAKDPTLANVDLMITNPGNPIPGAEVFLDVTRDGEPVETFSLGPAFALPQGETTLSERYVPPTGWEAGTWTFTVRVDAVDPSTGSSTTVATLEDIPPVDVGE